VSLVQETSQAAISLCLAQLTRTKSFLKLEHPCHSAARKQATKYQREMTNWYE